MPNLYNTTTINGANIEIMGYPFYAESVSVNEYFNRRETVRNKILGGTEDVLKGNYITRDFSFTTHIPIDPERPDVHNEIFKEMMSKPVEVVSPELGGKFNAEVIIKPNHAKVDHLELGIDVKEIPDKNSNIPGEAKFTVPAVKKVENTDKNVLSAKEQKEDKELNKKLIKCTVPFKKNQANACVKFLQEKLILYGFMDKKFKTGKYDKNTIDAVKKFQRATKGKLLVDGVFGKYTLKYLLEWKSK